LTAAVWFLPHAREELTASAEWYEARRPGLGVELLAEIDEAVGQIGEHPEAWPLWHADRSYRKRILDRFPYVIFFVLREPTEVDVVAVAHARRRPGYWVERVE
jgi:plasmid stabilization system protein ParE